LNELDHEKKYYLFKYSLLSMFMVIVMLLLASGCATTTFNYESSEPTNIGDRAEVSIGQIVNNTGHSNPRRIRYNVVLDIPVTEAIKKALISELQQANYLIGGGDKEISVYINSIVYGKSGTSLTFIIKKLSSNMIVFNRTFTEKGSIMIYDESGHMQKIKKCIRKFITNNEAKIALQKSDYSILKGRQKLFTKEDKPVIALANLESETIPKSEALIITNLLREALWKTNKFEVLERDQTDKIIKELGFQLTGCTETQCAAEIGGALNVEEMIVGSIDKLGGMYILAIRFVNVELINITIAESVRRKCTIEEIPQLVDELAIIIKSYFEE